MNNFENEIEQHENRRRMLVWYCFPAIILGLMLLIFLIFAHPARAMSSEDAIKAIIGEAEGESYQGKIAVAETIRHRGSLKGVFGLTAPRVVKKLYSQATYDQAKRAWESSLTTNYSDGAEGWGNAKDIKIFQKQKWFKKCEIVKILGRHYFWKIKR